MSKSNTDFFKAKKEWSKIKDSLLGCYLTLYFQKVLTTGKPIHYVDCFAGAGKFDDGELGSPLIAIKEAADAMERAKNTRAQRNHIDVSLIEKKYATRLTTNTNAFKHQSPKPQIINGTYEGEIGNIIKNSQGQNLFLYVDPYGIKYIYFSIFEQLNHADLASKELLLNFNSFGFFRNACKVLNVDIKDDFILENYNDDDFLEQEPTILTANSQSEEILNNIAGGTYWKDVVLDYKKDKIDGYAAEYQISRAYVSRLRDIFKYVLDMPVRLKATNRPKYRMIHACDSIDGSFLMAQNMQARKEELLIQVYNKGQLPLQFETSSCTSINDEITSLSTIKSYIADFTRKHAIVNTHLRDFIVNFYQSYNLLCDFEVIRETLKELSSEGIVSITRVPAFTQKTHKPSTFWDEKPGQEVYIMYKNQ